MNLLETSVQKVPLCRWVWLFNCAVLTGVCFIEGGMFFIETPPFSRGYIYLGGYVLEKLQRSGGGTFIGGYVYLAPDSTKVHPPFTGGASL